MTLLTRSFRKLANIPQDGIVPDIVGWLATGCRCVLDKSQVKLYLHAEVNNRLRRAAGVELTVVTASLVFARLGALAVSCVGNACFESGLLNEQHQKDGRTSDFAWSSRVCDRGNYAKSAA